MQQKQVQVFARIRPLTGLEVKREDSELFLGRIGVRKKQTGELSSYTLHLKKPEQDEDEVDYVEVLGQFRVPKSKPKREKKFRKFTDICTAQVTNSMFYQQAVAPLVKKTLDGQTCCCFAYGHTGSGKTHTILGGQEQMGMYQQAAMQMFASFPPQTIFTNASATAPMLQVRFGEVYNGEFYDLLNGNAKCYVREDAHGVVQIRGETVVDEETGRVAIQPLTTNLARNVEELMAIVEKGIKARAVGNSDVHAHSSRSHAVLEFEIVNEQLIETREEIVEHLSNLTTLGKEVDDIKMTIWERDHERVGELNKWVEKADARGSTHEESKLLVYLKKQVAVEQKQLELKCEQENELTNSELGCIGGTFVFVDLAGSEHAGYKTASGELKSEQEQQECREINKSLLALKMCMQSKSSRMTRGPYRDSKLTLVLRDHLKAKSSETVMIATLSPSVHHTEDTIHTLQYAQLVAGC